MAAVNVSAVVVGITQYAVPVVAVATAWLFIFGLQRTIDWIKAALGFSSGDADSEAEFWRKYNAGEALEGVDFVTEAPQSFLAFHAGGNAASEFVDDSGPLQPQYVSAAEYASEHPESAQSLPSDDDTGRSIWQAEADLDDRRSSVEAGGDVASDDPYGGAIDIDPFDPAYDLDPPELTRSRADDYDWDGSDNVSDSARASSPPLDLSVKLGGGWK